MQQKKDSQPQNFSDLLGFEILQKDHEKCIVKMDIHQRHLQGAGFVQGGIIATIADAAISIALGVIKAEDTTLFTVEMKINYISPASIKSKYLLADGKISHKGNLLSLGECIVYDSDNKKIAQVMGTWITVKNNN
ncbi:MAG: PaaI family thioesterase [Dehalococcoidia bacterium]|tara:strand:+ start:786 stop:1190 length:405 start_codon:yes stop_codon:yes gene_type:complete